MITIEQKKQLVKSRRDVLRKAGLLRHEVDLINKNKLDELFEKSASDFLSDKNILNDLVISLAARLQKDYGYTVEAITNVFDDNNHKGPHDLAAVLLLLKTINDCQDANAEAYHEDLQLSRESEARI